MPEPAQEKRRGPSAGLKTAAAGLLALLLVSVISGCGLFGFKSGLGPAAAKNARRHLGAPYQPGAAGPRSFDCSGLTYYVYHRLGLELPRSSASQAKAGRRVRRNNLRPGDLVFFRTGSGREVTHVGIYIGNQKFIHAPGRGKEVSITELNSEYFARRYHSARRVSS